MTSLRDKLSAVALDAVRVLGQAQINPQTLAPLCEQMKAFCAAHAPQACPVSGEPTTEIIEINRVRMGTETAQRFLAQEPAIVAKVAALQQGPAAEDAATAPPAPPPAPMTKEAAEHKALLDAAVQRILHPGGEPGASEYGHLGPAQTEVPPPAPTLGEIAQQHQQQPPPPETAPPAGSVGQQSLAQALAHNVGTATGWEPATCAQFVERFTHHWQQLTMHAQNEDWIQSRSLELAESYPNAQDIVVPHLMESIASDVQVGQLPESCVDQAEAAILMLAETFNSLE